MIHELRIYRCVPGRKPALLSRFENETLRIWEKHGIRQVGFWTTLIGKSSQEITYMLAWDSMAEREKRWGAFLADPEWVAVVAKTEKDGQLVENISSQLLAPAAFSIPAPKENALAEHATPATCGVDHVGLSVRDLESTRRFFCDCLGWRVVGERPEYPAAFVSDGEQIVTLWRVEAPDQAVAFDRRTNVGLHHLALAVADRAGLDALYERVASWPGVVVEFAPELSGKGPKIHFIVREPSGIRLEFAFDPRVERPR